MSVGGGGDGERRSKENGRALRMASQQQERLEINCSYLRLRSMALLASFASLTLTPRRAPSPGKKSLPVG
uniref:Uncharacterized protein n=1 Tax=Oryza glumipatula TaxID=40148 RepID=A0A0E0AWM7_9ORYZ